MSNPSGDKVRYRIRVGVEWIWSHQGLFGPKPLSSDPSAADATVDAAMDRVLDRLLNNTGMVDPDWNSLKAFTDAGERLNGEVPGVFSGGYETPCGDRFGEISFRLPLGAAPFQVYATSTREAIRRVVDNAKKVLSREELDYWPSEEALMALHGEPPRVRRLFHLDILPMRGPNVVRDAPNGLHVTIDEETQTFRNLLDRALPHVPRELAEEIDRVLFPI